MDAFPLPRHSGEGRNPELTHHWIPAFAGMTVLHDVIARLVRAIQLFFNLDYRDTPGNDIRRHTDESRYPAQIGHWIPAFAGMTEV